ncbi:MAG TPA: phage tail assembly chaperone [Brevundimonas sp.]|nr:phage tail assembly chaperone [Brevundimonas sp.]
MTPQPSRWGAMLRAAALMGIAPPTFWRLSLAEWRMLAETRETGPPISRAALTGLTEMWPDD